MPKILLNLSVLRASFATWFHPIANAQETLGSIEAQRLLRKNFQSLELTTSRKASWTFPLALPLKVVGRDAEAARKFGLEQQLVVRWFDQSHPQFPFILRDHWCAPREA